MNILVIGAHPDDPESGCGGLAIKAAREGHRVYFLYLSSGIPGYDLFGRPSGVVREEEAAAACSLCGAEPIFFRYNISEIPFDLPAVERLGERAADIGADLVLGHWPVDSQPDHQAAGVLATQIVVGNPGVALAYYEVCAGMQTFAFEPNRFVDITDVADVKLEAVECHASQEIHEWWHLHDACQRFRYAQAFGFRPEGPGHAEGYYLAVPSPEAEALFQMRTQIVPSGSRTQRKTKHERVSLYPHERRVPPE